MLASSSLFDPVIEERTKSIIQLVTQKSDAALIELTEKFDGARLTAKQLKVSRDEMARASGTVSEELRSTLALAARNIELFSKKSLRKKWSARNFQGASVGEKFDPIRRVGIYVPGGTAPLVSTVLMTVVLARVAGCEEIVVCSPCGKDGQQNPGLLLALEIAGATEVYRVGGSQAIAAMALGTGTIRPVQKIFGPGNAYVVAAKRLLYGRIGVDLLPGPSEVLVLGDETANPEFVAADMLAQAEHGSGYERVWLVTSSAALIRKVEKEIERQLPLLARREYVERALNNAGYLIQSESVQHGIELVNRIAPEHCEVMLKKASAAISGIRTAGAIFVGPWSPTVLGDYVAGPSHTLPTGGAGASFPGLTVDQFQRRTSVVQYGRHALKKSLAAVEAFGKLEGLDAHARSARIRIKSK